MKNEITKLAILGSTGSIGKQTLEIVRNFPERLKVVALAAGDNLQLLSSQIEDFKPDFVYYRNKTPFPVKGNFELVPIEEMAALPEVDIVVSAVAGTAGLSPTLAAVKAGKKIALANKESLVMAGEIVTREARLSGAQILPVDSEHSAIWQCYRGENKEMSRIILTASGGPFLNYSRSQLEMVTAAQALKHPSWNMGKKITIDSATLANKGLEVIEAHWLFDVPYDNIKVMIHPQCIIHSMVEFLDGSAKAQMGFPDMRLPIQYALFYPERQANKQLPRLDWSHLPNMVLLEPDIDMFPCLRLSVEAGKRNGTYPAVLCVADEIAVDLFLKGKIRFTDIAKLIEEALDEHDSVDRPSFSDILAAEAWTTDKVLQMVGVRR